MARLLSAWVRGKLRYVSGRCTQPLIRESACVPFGQLRGIVTPGIKTFQYRMEKKPIGMRLVKAIESRTDQAEFHDCKVVVDVAGSILFLSLSLLKSSTVDGDSPVS